MYRAPARPAAPSSNSPLLPSTAPPPDILFHPSRHRRREEDDSSSSSGSSSDSEDEHEREKVVTVQRDNTPLLVLLGALVLLLVAGVIFVLWKRSSASSSGTTSSGHTTTATAGSAKPSSSSSSSSTSDSADTPFAKVATDTHNAVRSNHSAPDLVYNDTLASAAMKWAENCEWEHSKGAVGPYGENLFMYYPSNGDLSDPSSGIGSWASEEKDYDYDDPGFSEETGHFTQLVWVGTTQFGCAYIDCDSGTLNSKAVAAMLVCEYFPAGNIVNEGEFAKNVIAPT